MTNKKFDKLFGGQPRKPETKLTKREMDLACSVQEVTEEVVLKMAAHLYKETGLKNLALAGGVALNCVANGRLLREGDFKNIWIQPAAGDAGGAIGAALSGWYQYFGNERAADEKNDTQKGSLLGPLYKDDEIKIFLDKNEADYKYLDEEFLVEETAKLISEEKVIGWFNGRMEFGPRALGARSILGDARSSKLQQVMNLKIKFRESFRPFAPAVLREKAFEYFDINADSPYMLLVADVKNERRKKLSEEEKKLFGIDKLNTVRSDIPAVTHVDYSARIQTVHKETNPLFYNLIKKIDEKENCAVVINTSFNVRGEPIVCTPEDAYKCFMRTNMDALVIGSYLLQKENQKPLTDDVDWKKEYELD